MKPARYMWFFVVLFVFTGVILYATGSLDNVTYKPVNSDQGAMGADVPAEVSIHGNNTFAVKLPEKISFAGEPVPMDNMDVRERLDRELLVNSYWHSSSILMLKRSHRWFPTIERILSENNIPEDFKYLAMAESGFQNVVSPAGATGYWQFMKAAAREQGLLINSEIDERYHVEKATEAACRHLQKLYDEFGSWTMAAAAYNMGQTGLRKQVARQKQNNYFDLLLNRETGRYVFRILALKSIHSAPSDFGFQLTEPDMYKAYPYKLFVIDEPVSSWPDYCAQNGITYRELKMLNPWLRESYLTNASGKEYRIKVLEK